MAILVGLYSPDSQSGKSTASAEISRVFQTEIIKVSGAMKAMCAAAIAPFVPEDELAQWVDGAYKDTIVVGLEPDCAQNPTVAAALAAACGAPDAGETDPLPITDAQGEPLTRARIQADLILAWGAALGTQYIMRGGLTPRDLQRTLGLEFGRHLYGMDFWLRPLAARVAASTADVVIIDDIRFPEDGDFVRDRNGVLVHVERPRPARTHDHPSEGLLDGWLFDTHLRNDSTLDIYRARICSDLIPQIAQRCTPRTEHDEHLVCA